jgi:hypothetical protein
MTLERASKRLLRAVLDTENLIFFIIIVVVFYSDYKNTKKVCLLQKYCEKIICFQTILVISQTNLKKYKNNSNKIMDLTGKVIAIMEARSGVSARTGNPWMTQEYVIEVPGQYPRKMVFNIFGEDRIKQFNIQPGEELTVQFDIDAREYNGRWFNDIRAYNIIRGQVAQAVPSATPFAPQQPAEAQGANAPFPPAQEPAGESTADDLPF